MSLKDSGCKELLDSYERCHFLTTFETGQGGASHGKVCNMWKRRSFRKQCESFS